MNDILHTDCPFDDARWEAFDPLLLHAAAVAVGRDALAFDCEGVVIHCFVGLKMRLRRDPWCMVGP